MKTLIHVSLRKRVILRKTTHIKGMRYASQKDAAFSTGTVMSADRHPMFAAQ
jgi:hypothetical protein